MISRTEYIQMKAFARQDGFFIGLLMLATGAFFIASTTDPSWQIGFIAGIVCTPFMLYARLRQYRDKVLEGRISYRRAFAYSTMLMCYGALIITIATLIYFSYFDNGHYLATMQQSIEMPEMRQTAKQVGLDPKMLDEQISALSQLRPMDIAFSIFFNTVVAAVFLGAFVALFGRRR